MSIKTELQKVSEETMRFMRGKYEFNEIGNGKDELAFLDGGEAVLTIYIRDGYYDFAIEQEVIRIADLNALEKAKEIIIAKKTPNRKPFQKTHIHMGHCGQRCDLCIHYKGKTLFSNEEMAYMQACHEAVFGIDNWEKNCNGCNFPDCTAESAHCLKEKDIDKCWACENYSTCSKTAVGASEIHTGKITADQITWAILPYVKGQYGN